MPKTTIEAATQCEKPIKKGPKTIQKASRKPYMTKYNTVRWEKTQFQADQWHNEAITKADAKSDLDIRILILRKLHQSVSFKVHPYCCRIN